MNPELRTTSESMEIPVLSKGGKRASVSVPLIGEFLANMSAPLRQAGFSSEELEGLVLWPSAAGVKPNPKLPVPKPTSVDDILPDRSDEIIVAANRVDNLFVQCDESFARPQFFLPVSSPLLDPLQPPFPKDVLIYYKLYWEKVKSWKLGPGISFRRDVGYKAGTTTQDSRTISATLGVEYGGLSAKLEATLNHSVSITEEIETSEHCSYDVDKNKVCVFTVWNLVHAVEFTDSAGKLLNWSGIVGPKKTPPGGFVPPPPLLSSPLLGVRFWLPKHSLTNRSVDVVQDPVLFDP